MKIKEIRDLSSAELKSKLLDSYQELFNLRFQLDTRKLNNCRLIGEVKKTIARINTILRQRELQKSS